MAVSAIDEPAKIVISEDGIKGANGTNGTDGEGFNNVRKSLIDNPVCSLYGKNHLVKVLKNVLNVTRTTSGAYTDIYGDAQTAPVDTAREETKGWLVNGDEKHDFQVFNNIPEINADFSVIFITGRYSETSPNQDVVVVPAVSGNLLTIGTDASGNWSVKLQDSTATQREVVTANNATSSTEAIIIITYTSSTGVLDVNINGALAGTVTLPIPTTAALKIDSSAVVVDSDVDMNVLALMFYDFTLNQDEITYLS